MTMNKAGGHGPSEDPMHGLSLCSLIKLMFMDLACLRAGLRPPTLLGPIENTGVTMYLSINEFLLLSAQQLNTVGG